MAFTMTPNTKWTLAVLAAFAVGVSTAALMSGKMGAQQSAQTQGDMQAVAEQLNTIQPTAGDATAKPAADKPADTSPVIAKVDGTSITLDEMKAYLKTMPEQVSAAPFEQVFPMAQDQMVIGHVISEKADQENLKDDPEVKNRIAIMTENVVRATYLEREVNKRTTDEALKKDYDAFVKDFKPVEEVSAQHILVDDEAKAKDIIKELAAGAKFDDLVKKYSKDKGAGGTGDLGYFKEGDMVKEFATAAFAMKKGDVSKTPTKTQFGYHVIKINDVRMTKAPTFEEIKQQLKAKAQRETLDTVIGDLRHGANIELFDDKGNPLPKAQPASASAPAPAAATPAQ